MGRRAYVRGRRDWDFTGSAPPPWDPSQATPGAIGFVYDPRLSTITNDGGSAIGDGQTVGRYTGSPGRYVDAPFIRWPVWRAARRGGRSVLEWGADRVMNADQNVPAITRVMAVAALRWPDVPRNTVDPPPAFGNASYPGLIALQANNAASVIMTGVALSSRWLRPDDVGGAAIDEARIDGVSCAYVDSGQTYHSVGTLDRVLRVFEVARASGWSGAPLVFGDDRRLLITDRQWGGAIVGAVGLTSSATADDIANARAWLLDYHQGGSCVAFVGDSITAGWGVAPLLSYRGRIYASQYGTVGCPTLSIPGGTIPQLAAQDYTALDAILRRSANPVLSVALGTNDIGTSVYLVDGGNPSTALAGIASFITARKASVGSKLKVVGYTLTARNDVNLDAANWATRKAAFDAGIRANHAAMGIDTLVDVAADATVGDPYVAGSFLDGVHPTSAGHAAIDALAQPAILSLLPA